MNEMELGQKRRRSEQQLALHIAIYNTPTYLDYISNTITSALKRIIDVKRGYLARCMIDSAQFGWGPIGAFAGCDLICAHC
jgi:hypothetical protein